MTQDSLKSVGAWERDQFGLESKVPGWSREGATGRDMSEFETESHSQQVKGTQWV